MGKGVCRGENERTGPGSWPREGMERPVLALSPLPCGASVGTQSIVKSQGGAGDCRSPAFPRMQNNGVKGMRVREQKHICGKDWATAPYAEVDIFEVTPAQHKASRRAKRSLATSLAMQKYNNNISRRYFCQLANANFGRKDWALTLSYNNPHLPAAEDEKRVDRDWTNYMRRVNRWCDKHEIRRPKWMEVPEYMDTDTGGKVTGRHHHHAIVEGCVPREVLEALWCDKDGDSIGLVRCEHIDLDHHSMEQLTNYMSQSRRHCRKWRQCRGLELPKRPAPNDSRWSKKRFREAQSLYIDDAAWWERQYPGYTPNSIEIHITGSGTVHMIAKLRRKNFERGPEWMPPGRWCDKGVTTCL